MRITQQAVFGLLLAAQAASAADLAFRDRFGKLLIERAPEALKTYDEKTGHFGSGIWICRDQESMYPLAAAYALDVPGNRYHRDAKLLETIMKAGDALAADTDDQGRWMFRKKDGSTWGMIHMPWTYSRWIRTFGLIRDDMPPERRAAWEKALLNGYDNISKTTLKHLHNIPTHHAMGLYIAGKLLDRPQWCTQAAEFLRKAAEAQSPNGYWSEGEGPVVNYNFVYVEAIGIYYAWSKDETVLPALERASRFHRNFTYPDGNCVETIDQRNPFHASVHQANVGFTFSPVGRAYLASQWAHLKDTGFSPDSMTSYVLYGQEGPIEAADASGPQVYVLSEDGVDKAMTVRQGPWFICLSAFTTPISGSRWIQDRQNLVSIYHNKTGLLVGGGNTKLQPGWSSFTVGDPGLLAHEPGDENPKFVPAGELYHVPSAAKLIREPVPGLDLTYGLQTCRVRVSIKDEKRLEYVVSASGEGKLPVVARLVLLPRMGETIRTGAGQERKLTDEAIAWTAEQVQGALHYAGCDSRLPACAGLSWPVLPHNPYVKDGHAAASEGRIEVRLPFTQDASEYRVGLTVP